MLKRRFRFALAPLVGAVAAAGIAGCSCQEQLSSGAEDGGPIATDDMHISATIEAADDVTVEVSAKVHNGDPLLGPVYSLTGGDAFSACVGMQCKPLARDFSGLLLGEYTAELPYVAETTYTISLSRPVGTNAPNTGVTLPVAFTILAPVLGLRVTDGDRVTVQWSPAGADDVVDVEGEARCDHEDGTRTTRRGPRLAVNVDTGAMVAEVDTILDGRALVPSQSRVLRCDIVIEVVHDRLGTADTRFGGGTVLGRVSRKVTLDYLPSQP